MARIIYGLSGQGFGHAARSKEILDHLISQGHQVLVFTYGQAVFLLSKKFDLFEIPGLGLSYKNNKVVYWNTVYKNTKQLLKQSRDWRKMLQRFRDFNPDLVFTDFEALTATLAKLQRVPLISIDNQHQLTNTKVAPPPHCRREFMGTKMIIKSMVWGAKYYLITSFFRTPITKRNTFLFPPIVRREVSNLRPRKENYVLVYQTSDFESLVAELKKINKRFIIFGLNVEKKEGNLEFKNYSDQEWLACLADCEAVVGNAGLSLISESLCLKKPYLAVPVKKQVEQIINAQYLEKLGYGRFTLKFTRADFEEFYARLPEYEANLKNYAFSDNSAICRKIDELVKRFF